MDIILKNIKKSKLKTRFYFEINKGKLKFVTLNYHNIVEGFKFQLSTQENGFNKRLYDNEFYLDVSKGHGKFKIILGFSLFSKRKFLKEFELER